MKNTNTTYNHRNGTRNRNTRNGSQNDRKSPFHVEPLPDKFSESRWDFGSSEGSFRRVWSQDVRGGMLWFVDHWPVLLLSQVSGGFVFKSPLSLIFFFLLWFTTTWVNLVWVKLRDYTSSRTRVYLFYWDHTTDEDYFFHFLRKRELNRRRK